MQNAESKQNAGKQAVRQQQKTKRDTMSLEFKYSQKSKSEVNYGPGKQGLD